MIGQAGLTADLTGHTSGDLSASVFQVLGLQACAHTSL